MKMKNVVFSLLVACVPSLSMAEHYPKIPGKGKHKGKIFHTGLRHKALKLKGLGEMHVKLEGCDSLPDSFDLRTLGVVPEVRDQGQCGSCWSFSKTASLESAILATGGKKLDLSEQELVSCDHSQWGCNGGILGDFKYQIDKGQALEADFPYVSGRTQRTGSCVGGLKPAAKGVGFAYIGAPNRTPTESELKCAIYKSHTIPWITVSANNNWGYAPASEKEVYRSCGRGQTNHAVGVVGWFKDGDRTAFIMRNSWGESWGDKGYMSLGLGCDSLGDEAAYLITDAAPCKPAQVKLPAEIQSSAGVEVLLGVKEVAGVDYTWYVDADIVGTGSKIYVTPDKDTIYKLVGKTPCGTSESSVRVKLVQAIE